MIAKKCFAGRAYTATAETRCKWIAVRRW